MLGVRGEGDDATLESVDRPALLVLMSLLHIEPSSSILPNKSGESSVASLGGLGFSRKCLCGFGSSVSVWAMSALASCLSWTLRIKADWHGDARRSAAVGSGAPELSLTLLGEPTTRCVPWPRYSRRLESALLAVTRLRQGQYLEPQRQVQPRQQPLACGMSMAAELELEMALANPPTDIGGLDVDAILVALIRLQKCRKCHKTVAPKCLVAAVAQASLSFFHPFFSFPFLLFAFWENTECNIVRQNMGRERILVSGNRPLFNAV
jgi:hypothetical protein